MARILIADDERSIRITLKAFLERAGYAADTAENAVEALTLFAENNYDLVLTDIVMPKMSGIELLEKLRQQDAEVPVIIMTGEPTVDTAVKSVQSGAFDYLSKPVTKAALLHVVEQAMRMRNLMNQKKRLQEENSAYQQHLETMVSERTKALEKTAQSTIMIMNSMMELRDPYTAGHQLQVGNLAAAIARKMDMSNLMIERVRVTGYLHDIGKIAVPLEILIKPSQLSRMEFEIVKEHANSGRKLLQNIDLPIPVADIVWQHHERLDGSGYPRGLQKDEILPEARILAVADVVEAMVSHRPYRPSTGIESALEEIEAKRGLEFDRDVVDACLMLFRQKDYQIENSFYHTTFSFD